MDVLTLANADKTMSKSFLKRRTNMNSNSLHSNSKFTVEISKGYQKVLADTVLCVKNECVDTSKCRQTMSTLSKFFCKEQISIWIQLTVHQYNVIIERS